MHTMYIYIHIYIHVCMYVCMYVCVQDVLPDGESPVGRIYSPMGLPHWGLHAPQCGGMPHASSPRGVPVGVSDGQSSPILNTRCCPNLLEFVVLPELEHPPKACVVLTLRFRLTVHASWLPIHMWTPRNSWRTYHVYWHTVVDVMACCLCLLSDVVLLVFVCVVVHTKPMQYFNPPTCRKTRNQYR